MIIHKLDRRAHKIFDQDKCNKCGEKFILNNYIVDSGLFLFHLTCFKKYSEDAIRKHEKDINIIKESINELKPYAKEMICESMLKEKYG